MQGGFSCSLVGSGTGWGQRWTGDTCPPAPMLQLSPLYPVSSAAWGDGCALCRCTDLNIFPAGSSGHRPAPVL